MRPILFLASSVAAFSVSNERNCPSKLSLCREAHIKSRILHPYPSGTNRERAVVALRMASRNGKDIYGVPGSGWASPDWNWGYAVGTGHDCALLCRRQYETKELRAELVEALLQENSNVPFEEVKLVLALAWQRGRWGGFKQVLNEMARAKRYEVGTEDECSRRLVGDMVECFHLLEPSDEDTSAMATVLIEVETNVEGCRQRCAGLVLKAMGFIESGL